MPASLTSSSALCPAAHAEGNSASLSVASRSDSFHGLSRKCDSSNSSSSTSSSDDDSKSASGSNGSKSGSVSSSEDDDTKDLSSDNDYEAYCKDLGNKAADAIAAGDKSSFSNVSGNFFVKAAHLANLSDISGNIHLIGTAADTSIDSISDMHGNIIICGMDVKEIKASTSGNLIIVGGDVGHIDGYSGNIRIVGGKLLNGFSNSNGNIASRF